MICPGIFRLESVSVVPVGLTRYREGLHPLEPFGKEDAKEILGIIHRWQEKLYGERGVHFIHGGDEWYTLAEEELPEAERYDGYLQLENGVGMLRLLMDIPISPGWQKDLRKNIRARRYMSMPLRISFSVR